MDENRNKILGYISYTYTQRYERLNEKYFVHGQTVVRDKE